MNKKALLIVGGLVVLVGLAAAYVLTMPKNTPTPPVAQTEPTTNTPSTSTEPPAVSIPGTYQEYSADKLAAATGRRVLFFYAAWCPQCRELDQTIREAKLPDNMAVFKVNYDTQTDLRQKYGITLQTTVVEIDAGGNVIKKHVAYDQPRWPAVLKVLGG